MDILDPRGGGVRQCCAPARQICCGGRGGSAMKTVILFTGTFIGSFALFAAQDVGAAAWERQSPASCMAHVSDNENLYLGNFGNGGPFINGDSGAWKYINCPISDNTMMWSGASQGKHLINVLNLHGEDRHSSASIKSFA